MSERISFVAPICSSASSGLPMSLLHPASTVHIVERGSPQELLYDVLHEAAPGTLLLDLSAGRLDSVSRIEWARVPDEVKKVQAADFAHDLADETRNRYVRWVTDVSEQVLIDGKSIKELFTYDGELSLWWITQAAQKDQENTPYRWFFFAFAIIDFLLESGQVEAGAEWHVWVPDPETGDVFEHAIAERGRVVVHVAGKRTGVGGGRARAARQVRQLNRTVVWPVKQVVNALRAGRLDRSLRRIGKAGVFAAGSPKVLVVTEVPHSWATVGEEERFDRSVSAYDRYFGTMPWDLRKQGAGVAWVASRSTKHGYARWRSEASSLQDLPDASPWSYLDFQAAQTLLRNQARWLRDYRRLFLE